MMAKHSKTVTRTASDYLGYHGHKLLAVDDTYLNLPNHPNIHEEFNRQGTGRGKNKDLPKSMSLLPALYDPVNYLTLGFTPDMLPK